MCLGGALAFQIFEVVNWPFRFLKSWQNLSEQTSLFIQQFLKSGQKISAAGL
jgi:hypothetical protein